MSELEKARREQHEKWRKKWIRFLSVIICIFAVSSLLSFCAFNNIKKNTYVPYSEDGNVIHRAYLADNKFYDENYLNGSHAYVASLIDKMTADFSYDPLRADRQLFPLSRHRARRPRAGDPQAPLAVLARDACPAQAGRHPDPRHQPAGCP